MKHRKPLPPQSLLRELFTYDPVSGIVRWIVHVPHSNRYAGDEVNSRLKKGYFRVMIGKSAYRLHLIIWKWVTGSDPKDEIDHRDLDGCNNRWSNLREATRSQNGANISLTCRNTSGFKGVSFCRPTSRWRASIRKNGRLYFLG